MLVKIINSIYPTMWYNDYIGDIFEVIDDFDEIYWRIIDSKSLNLNHLIEENLIRHCILKKDCTIITRKHKLEKIINKINEI